MKPLLRFCIVILCSLECAFAQQSQTTAAPTPSPSVAVASKLPGTNGVSTIPTVIRFGGSLNVGNGKGPADVVGVTFLLYREAEGGAPLWMETQNVRPDKSGHYQVVLGVTASQGLPRDLFSTGDARWLAVQVMGQKEEPRVLLVAVPYAMKAGDAETVGGLPASAFVLAAPASPVQVASQDAAKGGIIDAPGSQSPSSSVTTTGGTMNTLPLFTTATNVQNSAITQTGSGATAKIGVGTLTPVSTLDVKGGATVRGTLALPAAGIATATAGKKSDPLNLVASSFSSATGTAVNQTFQWVAEPAANDTANPSGTLNMLFGLGATTPSETGLRISSKGLLTFAAGQTFPGVGKGTVTNIATGVGLKGGPITGSGTLTIDTAVVPRLNVANTFTASQRVSGNISASGSVSGAASTFSGSNIGVSGTGSQYGGIFTTTTGGTGLYAYNPNDCASCVGIEGFAFGTTAQTFGVFGGTNSPFGAGVYGLLGDPSQNGTGNSGVWGDSSSGIGVLATAGNGYGLVARNNSGFPTIQAYQEDETGWAFRTEGPEFLGCFIDAQGNLNCSGTISGSAPTASGDKQVSIYAMESPENWLEDFGSGQLSGGKAVIRLERIFGQTVNTEIEYHVFLTPKGDCEGLYVSQENAQGFEVHELRGGHSGVTFDYRIVAKRKGFEKDRMKELRRLPEPPSQHRAGGKPPAPAKAAIGEPLPSIPLDSQEGTTTR